ncbi:MAG: FAD-binding protein, partial [Spirochaetes bacterium]|nr:FAD-binding protein [Spirochaetota bacterium]
MGQIVIKHTDQTEVGLDESAVGELGEQLRGELLLPGAPGYDEARKLWNAMHDIHPAMIARCSGASDVIAAVNFARDNDVLVSVRGGGHNVAGKALCEGGLTIDLSGMKGIRVDPAKRTVRVEPGVVWGELDRETQAFGLATTGGFHPTTGVAGLTLGGGLGYLMRRFGLAGDNLLSADMVTADGTLRHVSAEQNQELFWAIRGGGGNFGVVTSFEFRLHQLGPMVYGGIIFYPFDRARETFQFLREFMRTAPEELTIYPALAHSPDGNPGVFCDVCYSGPVEAGEEL